MLQHSNGTISALYTVIIIIIGVYCRFFPIFLLITQNEVPFLNKSEATQKKRKRQMYK